AGLKQVAGLKSLQSLDLSQTRVTDAGLMNLRGLQLKSLEIPEAAKTDLGLKHYLAIVSAPLSLCLHGWNVSEAGLKELAGLKKLHELTLGVWNCEETAIKSPVTDGW